MHEYGIAIEILRICQETLRDQSRKQHSVRQAGTDEVTVRPALRLEKVRVLVGELSSVEPDLLVFAWEAAISDTDLAGSRMEVVWRPASQFCDSCCKEAPRVSGEWHPNCLKCGAILRVEGGDELDVLDLAIEEESVEGVSP